MNSIGSRLIGLWSAAASAFVVEPVVIRLAALALLAIAAAMVTWVGWVTPLRHQADAFTAAAQELALAAPKQSVAPGDPGDVQDSPSPPQLQQVLHQYPRWQSDQFWLQRLVNLANDFGVSTLALKFSGMRREEAAAVAITSVQEDKNHPHGRFEQRGYQWRLQGSAAGVSALLAALASRAFWIDELVISTAGPKAGSSHPAQTFLDAEDEVAPGRIQALLAFRQSVRILSSQQQVSGDPVKEPVRPLQLAGVALPGLAAAFALKTTDCLNVKSAIAGNPESTRVFVDHELDAIRYVGLIEELVDSGAVQQRGIFRNVQGDIVVAADRATISARELRLAELNKQRAILLRKDDSVVVMMLEPLLAATGGTATLSASEAPYE